MKLFFRFRFPNSSSSLSKSFPCFAGCKCRTLFQISQAFLELFFFRKSLSLFVLSLPVFRWAFFVVAGAKVEPFSASASFFMEFFSFFFGLFLNLLVTVSLRFDFFSLRVGFFFSLMCFSRFSGIPTSLFWRFLSLSWFFYRFFQGFGFSAHLNPLPKTTPLAPIGAEILFMARFAMKRL